MYKKGQRLVFSSYKEKGAKPSSSTKQESTAKDKDTIEHEFELIDLETKDQTKNMRKTIRDKDYQIKELAINLEREKYVISFLEQENSQLKAKELILEKEKAKLMQQIGKVRGS